MKKGRHIILALVLLGFAIPMVASHGDENISKAEELIRQKVPCQELSDEQLELIGDYYMEQMHQGDAHAKMDAMMGGENSESLRDMHMRMAKAFYCGEHQAMAGMKGMMNMSGEKMRMMCMNSGGPSAHHSSGGGNMQGMMSGAMMGGMGGAASLLWLVYLAVASFVFSVIFWWSKNLVGANKR